MFGTLHVFKLFTFIFAFLSKLMFGKGFLHLILFIHGMYMYGTDGHVAHLGSFRNALQNFGQE
jgi:hypothetical protein